jgi:hypothetical protein
VSASEAYAIHTQKVVLNEKVSQVRGEMPAREEDIEPEVRQRKHVLGSSGFRLGVGGDLTHSGALRGTEEFPLYRVNDEAFVVDIAEIGPRAT